MTLIVLLGPTAVGKTDLSIALAQHFDTEIVSADSRQLYREMDIGTAPPSPAQLRAVKHHFIKSRSIFDDYTAGKYELDALPLLNALFARRDVVLLVGGSGLYIDAVCRGIDNIPATDSLLRRQIMQRLQTEGIESLRFELQRLDPDMYRAIDVRNPQRVARALEVCLASGKRYSSLRKNFEKQRPFDVVKIGLQIDRDLLYRRINARVDAMLDDGLIDEARRLYPSRDCNALKTVGYRELFDHFDGNVSLDEAVALIKRNTRHYAKRQISWFGRYDDIHWFAPTDFDNILQTVNNQR
jgi:tRNA dimethylallyltransferase